MIEKAKESAMNQAEYAAETIDKEFEVPKSIVTSIVDDLSSGELKDAQLRKRLESTIKEHPKLSQIGVAYAPFVYDANEKLYGFAYIKAGKEGEEPELIEIPSDYDYDYTETDKPGNEWYHRPLKEGPCWPEPSPGEITKELFAEYAAPFYRNDESSQEQIKAGVIFANFSLDKVRHLVCSLDLGKTGYGFIITLKNNFISYPIKEYLGKNIDSLDDSNLKEIVQTVIDGRTKSSNHVTGQSSWVFSKQIHSTGWTMGVVFNQRDVFDSTETLRRRRRGLIAMGVIAFLLFLSALLFRADKGGAPRFWGVASCASFLFIAGIWFIWAYAITDPANETRAVSYCFASD